MLKCRLHKAIPQSAVAHAAALTLTLSRRGGDWNTRMLAKLKTYSLVGIEALPVEVEVDVSPSGLPKQVHLRINPRKQNT